MTIGVRRAQLGDVEELASLAAATFPLACPPGFAVADMTAFVQANLSDARFRDYLADPTHVVLVYQGAERINGYILMMEGATFQPQEGWGVTHLPAAYLSKCYVHPESHGGAVAAALLEEAKRVARAMGVKSIWLNTNQENRRACRFYLKHGFEQVGEKPMMVGNQPTSDFVFEYVITRSGGGDWGS